ncbi:hypothetical protein MHU86_3419 [Fragilaria crotonensis]|nr:hypothetical protein MHU86_3419 [Fragilaria crotonensis]
MPTIRFNLTKADKKSKKKDSSPFLASETEPPVVISADVNIPAATPTHPTLYLTRSKRAKLGNQQTTMKKKKLPTTHAAITYESDTDEAAVIAEAIERANSERNNKSSRATNYNQKTHPYIQGILTTPIGRNKTFRATETDDDDNDEAASNAEAIDSATAERSNTHKVMRIKQEYIPDIQGTHHPSPIRSYQPQTDVFDESDVDDDDQDDDYSVRSDDDRKIPAPTRPKSTRKRQFDDSDVPASSPLMLPLRKECVFRRKNNQRFVIKPANMFVNVEVNKSISLGVRTFTRQKVKSETPPALQDLQKELPLTKIGATNPEISPLKTTPWRTPISQFPTTTMIVVIRTISSQESWTWDTLDPRAELPMTFLRRSYRSLSVLQLRHLAARPSIFFPITQTSSCVRPVLKSYPRLFVRARQPRLLTFPSPNYQRPTRDQPNGHARVPNYNGDPVDDDEMTDASDDIPARSTTNIYRDDDMDDDDDDDSDVVNASSVFSIYCPCPKQLCLSVRDQTLPPTKAQKVPIEVEVEEQSNGDKKESPKQLDALPMIQNSPYSVPDSSDNDDSTDTSSFIPDSFTVKTLDSLTLMDRMTTRKATKNAKMTKNIPRPARPLPPTKSKQFATPINVANPFLCQATYQCCNPIHHFN